MANKKSIQDVDALLDEWHQKLNLAVRKINEYRTLRKKLVAGKIKHPPAKGVVHKWDDREQDKQVDYFNDEIPVAPGSSGPC